MDTYRIGRWRRDLGISVLSKLTVTLGCDGKTTSEREWREGGSGDSDSDHGGRRKEQVGKDAAEDRREGLSKEEARQPARNANDDDGLRMIARAARAA
jgi:hypothetical protein